MITGAHAIIYSRDADADRAFLADVLELPYVDAGDGWLIFALPPAEVATHPTDGAGRHELYLMCDDIRATVAELEAKGVRSAAGSPRSAGGRLRPSNCPAAASSGCTSPSTLARRTDRDAAPC